MPRLRWRLQTSMVLVALLAVAISGWIQVDQWKREELEQRRAMMRALPELRLRRFFGRQGMRIIREASDVQFIQIDPRVKSFAEHWGDPDRCPVTATGRLVEPEAAARLSRALLDGSKYFSLSDLPDRPLAGFRFRRGVECLEIALSHSPGGHFDIWAFQTDSQGAVVHGSAQSNLCREDPYLADLIREIAGDDFGTRAGTHR